MKTHYQYLVIGGGSGGVSSARRAASYGASVLLVESKLMGGTCVNVGCVPKKVMWYAADIASKLKIARDYGFRKVDPSLAHDFDWATYKTKRDAYVKRLNGIYESNLSKENVDYVFGSASFNKDGSISVVDKDDASKITKYTADKILIATGGKPNLPTDIPGFELGITSDGFFRLEKQPKRVALVGSGFIAVEFCGVFNALGSETHLIVRHQHILSHFDQLITDTITDTYSQQGITFHKYASVQKVEKNPDGSKKVYLTNGDIIDVDELVWCIGRKSLVDIHPENINLKLNERGKVVVDEWQATNVPNVYSLGDVVGHIELTPVAIATGRKLSNRLFGPAQFKEQKMDFDNVPSAVFAHPEVGTIGLTERAARAKYGDDNIKVYTSRFNSMAYAMTEHKVPTAYKLVCLKPENERVIGLHIVGDGSSEILQGFGVAIKMGATKADFDNCVAIHPTSAEELVTMR
ncbi:DEKNAAC104791 [Brettanomyces naardenensis]|uniref:Glutathione reductase n=1 Tax=Brettanomyces naardenensis TaxID=13370 RepID=A0A448YRU6_BRENA|nr:DEKNAAC104791 [Brettanomyces naardenensis]